MVGLVETSFGGSLSVYWSLHIFTFFPYKLIMSTTSSFSYFSIYNGPHVIIYITFWWNFSYSSMLCLIALWNLQKLSLFLEPNSFFVGKHLACTNISYNLSMVTLKTFSFFLPKSTTFTPPLLKAWLSRGLELMLGASSKVIHPALNNHKSFLLIAEQLSILWPGFPARYSYVRSSLYQFRKEGFSGGNEKGATWPILSNFAYISFKGIGRGRSCSKFLW